MRNEKKNEKLKEEEKKVIKFLSFTFHFPASPAGGSPFILSKGQALITLIFFMIIGITITSAAVVMTLVNSRSGTKQQQGEIAYQIALSGAENGVIRLLRTPTYAGETLPVGSGSAQITATGSGTVVSPYIITSKGTIGSFVRKVEIKATYLNNLLSVTSQKEIF